MSKECKNKEDLEGNPFSSNEKLFRDNMGYCYRVEEFRNAFLDGLVTKHPFTREAIWKNKEQFMLFLRAYGIDGKPLFSDKERRFLLDVHYPPSLGKEYEEIVDKIGWTGAILKADNSTLLGPSAEAKNQLQKEIKSLSKEQRDVILNRRSPLLRSSTLKDLVECDDMCVHGLGSHLLALYLETQPKKIIPCLLSTDNKQGIIFPFIVRELLGKEYENIMSITILQPKVFNYMFRLEGSDKWIPDEDGYDPSRKEISKETLDSIDDLLSNSRLLEKTFDCLLLYCKDHGINLLS